MECLFLETVVVASLNLLSDTWLISQCTSWVSCTCWGRSTSVSLGHRSYSMPYVQADRGFALWQCFPFSEECKVEVWIRLRQIIKKSIFCLSEVVRWTGCLTSQLTIFQSYMWRHIDVQAYWRRELDLQSGSQCHRHFVGFFNVPIQAQTRDHPFYTVIPTHRPNKSPFTTCCEYRGRNLTETPASSRGLLSKSNELVQPWLQSLCWFFSSAFLNLRHLLFLDHVKVLWKVDVWLYTVSRRVYVVTCKNS